ncbi:unnamed protein product [Symbiodinium sp. CCMP2592]|nr:unnamed protein product [Symbiodinium sp. CCMP2592]
MVAAFEDAQVESQTQPLQDTAAEPPACVLCQKTFAAQDLTGRWTSKKCKTCAALEMKLWRQLGSFEPWKNTTAAEKAEFYKGSGEYKDWPTLEARLTDVLTSRAVRFQKECEKGEYLPATVYLAKGFTQEHIDNCDDRREHPHLGETILEGSERGGSFPTIRIPIQSRSTGEIRESIQEEINKRVKDVRKKKGDPTTKDWDLPSHTSKESQTAKAETAAKKAAVKAKKQAVAVAQSSLASVTSLWCSVSTWEGKETDPALLAKLKDLKCKLGQWKLSAEQVLAKKDTEEVVPLAFSKSDLKTLSKEVQDVLGDCKQAQKEKNRLKKAAKEAKPAATEAENPPTLKRRRVNKGS